MIIKINKNILWVSLIGLLVIVGIILTIISNPGDSSSNELNTESKSIISSDSQGSLAKEAVSSRQQTATMGAVTVDIEPIALGITEEKNIFSVAFNTHSVELAFDFTDIITLKDDLGNSYKALEWTGNSGWHHVSGDIIFPSINNQASQVILTISEIEGQKQIFKWEVN